jgi:hypothetical protein
LRPALKTYRKFSPTESAHSVRLGLIRYILTRNDACHLATGDWRECSPMLLASVEAEGYGYLAVAANAVFAKADGDAVTAVPWRSTPESAAGCQ